jgi:putative transposase
MLKAYKYRIYPTKEQETLLQKHFGCSRWVYNWALAERVKFYEKEKKTISVYELQAKLPILKSQTETAWLSEVSAQSLQSALHNLDKSFSRFFKEKKGFPKFKSKHNNRKSFQVSQFTSVDFDKNKVYIFKFKQGIKCECSRQFKGKIKTTTISQTPTGKYYVSILVENGQELPQKPEKDINNALGLDFGIKDLVIGSNGTKIENPKTLKKYLKKLKRFSRAHSRKKKGGTNRNKARLKLARLYEKISNIRHDYLHKISKKLICENQATTICLEDLSVSSMLQSKNKHLNRSIQDVGWYLLKQMLMYKADWYGKNIIEIGRFEASSKTCSNCGHINSELTLKDREWTCVCGANHDRDINAAINIKKFAFMQPNTSSKPKITKIPRGTRKSKPVDHCVSDGKKQERQGSSN